MKNIKKYIGILAFIIISTTLMAQAPPPPNNDNGTPGAGNTPVGGGAPIADGLIMLLSASLFYLIYTKKDRIKSLIN